MHLLTLRHEMTQYICSNVSLILRITNFGNWLISKIAGFSRNVIGSFDQEHVLLLFKESLIHFCASERHFLLGATFVVFEKITTPRRASVTKSTFQVSTTSPHSTKYVRTCALKTRRSPRTTKQLSPSGPTPR